MLNYKHELNYNNHYIIWTGVNKIKNNKKNISIRTSIIISYILAMLITVGLISFMVFSSWLSSAEETAIERGEEMSAEIYNQIDIFMEVPESINEAVKGLLEDNIVDINNEIERSRFFVGIIKAHNVNLYSLSYGADDGKYYGVRRNGDNNVEIIVNDESTGGKSLYYSVNEDMSVGELVFDAGKFDPRNTEWYKAALASRISIFSPIYKRSLIDDLTISSAVPIHNKNGEVTGVLGAHITLSTIDNYLQEIVKENKAQAVIIEKNSGELVSNSLGLKNFSLEENNEVKRLKICDINNEAILEAYKDYKKTNKTVFKTKKNDDTLHISLTEYNKDGLEWLVITAVPESFFTVSIFESIKFAVILTIVAVLLAIVIYLKLANKFFKPIDSLIETTKRFSIGDLSQRAVIVRNDEIGKISKSFNKMADMLCILINNLELKIKVRTLELEDTNSKLKENKDQLRLILDSTVEAIYGMDIDGKCTFINSSGLKILGYSSEEELLYKDIHLLTHHTCKDGKKILLDQCKIYRALLKGEGAHSDEEIFWRADGTSFNVEYYSYPQLKDGKIVGAVVTFMDNTERKKQEEHIKYLSYHDYVTGLYNRRFFDDEIRRLDTKKSFPLSIILGDVNGLKLTNDIFGHDSGDELLIKLSEVLKKICREDDVAARIGGDEFGIIFKNTEEKDAEKIIKRIKEEFAKERIFAIKGSISMGYATKIKSEQSIARIIEAAEIRMYKDKISNKKNINSDLIKTIMETLHKKSHKEKLHSVFISELCEKIGLAMNMKETELRKLKEAAFLHDIGKIILNEDILKKDDNLNEQERKEMEQHASIGFRILNLFDETLDLAEVVLNHHENWDGSGYPKGLKGEQIPKLARIIRLAESYDSMTNTSGKDVMDKEKALEEIKKQSGKLFDPDIVDVFIKMI